MADNSSFSVLLKEMIAADGGTKSSFGLAVGMTPPVISRLLHDREQPSIMACLRLAHYTHRSPLTVLRAGGHHDCAELLVRLYGAPVVPQRSRNGLTPAEERFTKDYLRKLPRGELHAVKILVTKIVRTTTTTAKAARRVS